MDTIINRLQAILQQPVMQQEGFCYYRKTINEAIAKIAELKDEIAKLYDVKRDLNKDYHARAAEVYKLKDKLKEYQLTNETQAKWLKIHQDSLVKAKDKLSRRNKQIKELTKANHKLSNMMYLDR